MTEKTLTTKIKKALEALGCYVAKIHGGQYSAGVPDLLGCYHGYFFAMEVKMPGKEKNVTALQRSQLDKIGEADGFAFVVTSVEEAERCLELIA